MQSPALQHSSALRTWGLRLHELCRAGVAGPCTPGAALLSADGEAQTERALASFFCRLTWRAATRRRSACARCACAVGTSPVHCMCMCIACAPQCVGGRADRAWHFAAYALAGFHGWQPAVALPSLFSSPDSTALPSCWPCRSRAGRSAPPSSLATCRPRPRPCARVSLRAGCATAGLTYEPTAYCGRGCRSVEVQVLLRCA